MDNLPTGRRFLTSAFGSYILASDDFTWNVLFTWSAYGALALATICLLVLKAKPDKADVRKLGDQKD